MAFTIQATLLMTVMVRDEALVFRMEVKDLPGLAAVAVGWSWRQPEPRVGGEGGEQPRQSRDGLALPEGPGLVSGTGKPF